jgi:hypothetical protein
MAGKLSGEAIDPHSSSVDRVNYQHGHVGFADQVV